MKKTICVCIILIFIEIFIAYSGFTGNEALFSGLWFDESNFIISMIIIGILLVIINIIIYKRNETTVSEIQKKIVIILFIMLLILKILLILINNFEFNKCINDIKNINNSVTNVNSFDEILEVGGITEKEKNILTEKGSLLDDFDEKLKGTSLILGYNVYYAATFNAKAIRFATLDGIWANYKYNKTKYSDYKKRIRK